MLATLVAEPFDRPGWIYEEKYDGDRILAFKRRGQVRLRSRNGKDRTDQFGKIAMAVAKLPPASLILDGEAVVFDRQGVSHFQSLQQGAGTPVYVVFDCLYCDGRDLRDEPLSARKTMLENVFRPNPALMLSRELGRNGLEAYQEARRKGLEGLVAKDLGSSYEGVRSTSWLKVKVHREDEFVILGYTPPEGKRSHFGALLVGAFEKGKLRYAGRVGTGFDRPTLAALYKKFQPLRVQQPAFEPPPGKGQTYLKPRLVAQISYQELTADKKLRQPVFLGLRDDKTAREVEFPRARPLNSV
ncbi:MAG TPA: non-homologous end-joining DNA ligase [Rhizomicrobium sp.]|nr:non-homologous end-joining DNA ligase [Rhizomicrobium sp.]HWC64246.1 non-homologous end-joining DNA ligase [Rhizomicrobium sp.]